ncbi:MAG TPA: PspC domain-containing protein [bacterium]|nr:PspC domain-containing protein [bacterium]
MAQLRKSARNRMVFGVAGGLAEYFRVDPAIIRALFILAAFASGVGVLIYLVLALLMARPESIAVQPLDAVKENLRTAPREAITAARRLVHVLRGETMPAADSPPPADTDSEGTVAR